MELYFEKFCNLDFLLIWIYLVVKISKVLGYNIK